MSFPLIMNRNKFEYFLNAVHYCMWLREKKFAHFMEKLNILLAICFAVLG